MHSGRRRRPERTGRARPAGRGTVGPPPRAGTAASRRVPGDCTGRRCPRGPPHGRPCARTASRGGSHGDRGGVGGVDDRDHASAPRAPRAGSRVIVDRPRRGRAGRYPHRRRRAASAGGSALKKDRRRPTLPGPCRPSTIGATGLDCSVRNGKRYFPRAIATGNLSRPRLSGPSKLHNPPTNGHH